MKYKFLVQTDKKPKIVIGSILHQYNGIDEAGLPCAMFTVLLEDNTIVHLPIATLQGVAA